MEQKNLEKQKYLFYSESMLICVWDGLMTAILLFTSVFRPYQVAFDSESIYSVGWNVANLIFEIMFFVDILVEFNTAFYETDFNLVEDRKKIAQNYLGDQFLLDFTALVPIDYILILAQVDIKQEIIICFRLYKMIRFTRLFKVYNEVTDLTKSSYFRDLFQIDSGLLRLGFFLLLFFLLCHFTSCLFVIVAKINQIYNETEEPTWLDEFEVYQAQGQHFQLYIVSFYWTITTITTVGYGDITASNLGERLFCSFMMILGVISFSLANGTLSQILIKNDNKKIAYQEQVEILNKIQKQYKKLPPSLYKKMKMSLGYQFQKSNKEIELFVEQLPMQIRDEVNLFIHEEKYKHIKYFQDKSAAFVSWTCALLTPCYYQNDTPIFMEGDEANSLHFLFKGECAFFLPTYHNACFINVKIGEMFGLIDILGSSQQNNF